MEHAAKMWQFLDELASTDPAAYHKYLREQMANATHAQPQTTTHASTPRAAFVIKMTLSDKTILHVNVAAHEKIKPPEATPDGSVPIAVGRPRRVHTNEHAGLVADVVVAPSVTHKAMADESFRHEVAALAASCVREVYRERRLPSVAPGYRLLPSPAYVGEPVPFADARADPPAPAAESSRSAAAEPPLIVTRPNATPAPSTLDELKLPGARGDGKPSSSAPPLVQELASSAAQADEPEYVLETREGAVHLLVRLPRIAAASDVQVEVGQGALSLHAEGVYRLRVSLPSGARCDDACCRFLRKRRELSVSVPLESSM